MPYIIETLHICLLRLVLLECKFSFDLLERAIKPLLVLVHPALVGLVELRQVLLEVFQLVTHVLLVCKQMLQPLRE